MENLTAKELKVIAKEKWLEFKNNATQKEMLELLTPKTKTNNMWRVMDRVTKKVIIIDWDIEKDWQTKYLHPTGKEFIF